MSDNLAWWERVCRPIRHEEPGGPADVPARTWALVLDVNARMRRNAEDGIDLGYGADPDASLAALGLPARREPVGDLGLWQSLYYAEHRVHMREAARERYHRAKKAAA